MQVDSLFKPLGPAHWFLLGLEWTVKQKHEGTAMRLLGAP